MKALLRTEALDSFLCPQVADDVVLFFRRQELCVLALASGRRKNTFQLVNYAVCAARLRLEQALLPRLLRKYKMEKGTLPEPCEVEW